jgi:hypothetical protein
MEKTTSQLNLLQGHKILLIVVNRREERALKPVKPS